MMTLEVHLSMNTVSQPSPISEATSARAAAWSGRVDGDGPEHARWHQRVRIEDVAPAPWQGTGPGQGQQEHVAILGFRSDEGVRRNRGRTGAKDGPAALRSALSPLALHGPLAAGDVALIDCGDAQTVGEDLERGQQQAADRISAALDRPGNRLTVVLGGGHETAWASYLGLIGSGRGPAAGERWGVLNLDAHFDLREEQRATSGTPFAQMARAEQAAGRRLRYCVLGIAEPSNTRTLFDRAHELGVRWMSDLDCIQAGPAGITQAVEDFARDLDVLYMTIDLDVLPAATAPGVSAPAGLGVPLPLVLSAVRAAAGTGKLALADVVELNPALDHDGRTARTAARLIDEAVRTTLASTSRQEPPV